MLTTAQRWVPALLPTLTAAFGTTTTTMTSIMGVGQFGGVLTFFTARHLNERSEYRIIRLGIAGVGLSSAVALGGVPLAFAASFLLLVIGHTHVTVASHAWIGHRVPFARRGRAIGLFEVSWSLGILIGTPVVGAIVGWWGWRLGYGTLVVGCAAAYALVSARLPTPSAPNPLLDGPLPDGPLPDGPLPEGPLPDGPVPDGPHSAHADRAPQPPHSRGGSSQRARQTLSTHLTEPFVVAKSLPTTAWSPILASALAAMVGIGFFAIASTWLADTFGVSTGWLATLAFGYGLVELVASSSVAAAADRIGTRRAMIGGLVVLATAAVCLGQFGDSLTIAAALLLAFFFAFEVAFVSSLALVTEAAPDSRGTAIGTASAIGTIGRGLGVMVAGMLYARFGIDGPLWMAVSGTVASIALLGWGGRGAGGTMPSAPERNIS